MQRPGNLMLRTLCPDAYSASQSFFTCVVLPDRSRPSITMNAPRLMGWDGSRKGKPVSEAITNSKDGNTVGV